MFCRIKNTRGNPTKKYLKLCLVLRIGDSGEFSLVDWLVGLASNWSVDGDFVDGNDAQGPSYKV